MPLRVLLRVALLREGRTLGQVGLVAAVLLELKTWEWWVGHLCWPVQAHPSTWLPKGPLLLLPWAVPVLAGEDAASSRQALAHPAQAGWGWLEPAAALLLQCTVKEPHAAR